MEEKEQRLAKIQEMIRSSSIDMRELGKTLLKEENLREVLGIYKARDILERYPEAVVGGSIALYLYGVRLDRWDNKTSDVDIVMPYHKMITIGGYQGYTDYKPSNNDFDFCTVYPCGTIVDLRIDPKVRYRLVTLDDFTYRVCLLEDIIGAKCRYCKEGRNQEKHRADLYKMFSVKRDEDTEREVKPAQDWGWSQGS